MKKEGFGTLGQRKGFQKAADIKSSRVNSKLGKTFTFSLPLILLGALFGFYKLYCKLRKQKDLENAIEGKK